MKSFKLLLSFIVLAAAAAAPVVGAETTPTPASPATGEVQLTPEQQAKIAQFHKDANKELKTVKTDTKMKDADKKAKIKEIKAKLAQEIADVKAGK